MDIVKTITSELAVIGEAKFTFIVATFAIWFATRLFYKSTIRKLKLHVELGKPANIDTLIDETVKRLKGDRPINEVRSEMKNLFAEYQRSDSAARFEKWVEKQ